MHGCDRALCIESRTKPGDKRVIKVHSSFRESNFANFISAILKYPDLVLVGVNES